MRGCARSTWVALLVCQTVSAAQAGERSTPIDPPATVSGATSSDQRATKGVRSSIITALDRVAYAVDGAESSHGEDLAMWGPDPSGPQGPMQVSEPAAADVGGGDRFDPTENRAIGRAYLAQLYRRYRNWPDAIAAYDSGMCDSSTAAPVGSPKAPMPRANRHPRQTTPEEAQPEADSFALVVCADLDAWGGALDEKDRPPFGAQSHFYSKLERATVLAMQHLPASLRSGESRVTASWKQAAQRR